MSLDAADYIFLLAGSCAVSFLVSISLELLSILALFECFFSSAQIVFGGLAPMTRRFYLDYLIEFREIVSLVF